MEKYVSEQIDGFGEGITEHFCIEAQIFPAGKRIEDTAHGIDLAGDVQCGTLCSSLEQQMFNEMGYPVLIPPVVTGTVRNPDTDGHGMSMGYSLGDDPDSIVQLRFDYH